MTQRPEGDEEETEREKFWRRVICARCDFVELVACIMEMEFLYAKTIAETTLETKEEYYGFHARDVAYLHHHKVGRPRGFYFRLYGGRVFDASGKEQEETDRALYDQTFEPEANLRRIFDKSLN